MVLSQHVTLTYFSILFGITCGFLPTFPSSCVWCFCRFISIQRKSFIDDSRLWKIQNIINKFDEMLLLLLSAIGNVCLEAATVTMDRWHLVNGRGNFRVGQPGLLYWPICSVCPQWLFPPSLLPCGGEDSASIFKVPSHCLPLCGFFFFAIFILPLRHLFVRMSLYFHIFALYLCDFEVGVRGGKVVFQVKS